MSRFIVIEDFCGIIPMQDENGYAVEYDSYEEALEEAEQLQNGKVIEIK